MEIQSISAYRALSDIGVLSSQRQATTGNPASTAASPATLSDTVSISQAGRESAAQDGATYDVSEMTPLGIQNALNALINGGAKNNTTV